MPGARPGASRRRYLNAAKHRATMTAAWLRTITPGPEGDLPHVVVIGGQRCGTTSLFRYLGDHPDVVPARSKELNYFSLHHGNGIGWYRGLFPHLEPGQRTIEASPLYLIDQRVPRRAAQELPDAHFVALLRNPTERAYSQYLHNLEHGFERLSFADAIDAEADRMALAEAVGLETTRGVRLMRNASYVHRGLYADHLERWREHVAPERIHVLRSEDLFAEPHETYGRLLMSLGLRPDPHVRFSRMNHWEDDAVSELTPELRTRLDDRFAEPNERLRRMLSWQQAWTRQAA